MPKTRKSKKSAAAGLILLLLLLAGSLPFGKYLAGVLPGGGRHSTTDGPVDGPEDGKVTITVVEGSDRKPVEGARVMVRARNGREAAETTDARGRAAFDGPLGGPMHIEAWSGGRHTDAWSDGTATEVWLDTRPLMERRGRVVTRAGTPTQAAVLLLDRDQRVWARTKTKPDGSYALPRGPVGASVCAIPENGPPAAAFEGDLVIGAGTLVRGRMPGSGASEIEVFGAIVPPGGDHMAPYRLRWPIRADGTFEGRIPNGGKIWATVNDLPLRVNPSGTVTKPRAVKLSGKILRADGKPALGATIVLRPLVGADFAPPLPPLLLETEADGSFTATVAQMDYRAEVGAADCARRVIERVDPSKPVEILLAPGFGISGVVLDIKRRPIANATIVARGVPDERAERPARTVRTDREGRFVVGGLGGSEAEVEITARGYVTTRQTIAPATNVNVSLKAAN